MRDFVNMLSHTLSLHKFESQYELAELLKFLFITLTNDIKVLYWEKCKTSHGKISMMIISHIDVN